MTLNKIIKKYKLLRKGNYETISIEQVLNDLWQVKSIGKLADRYEDVSETKKRRKER